MKNAFIVFACLLTVMSFGYSDLEKDSAIPSISPMEDSSFEPGYVMGTRVHLRGKLGNIHRGAVDSLLQRSAVSRDVLMETRSKRDSLGYTHVRVEQFIDGIPVLGARMTFHADKEGNVYAVSGKLASIEHTKTRALGSSRGAIVRAQAMSNRKESRTVGKPSLAYVMKEDGNAYLAYKVTLAYEDELGPQVDDVYVDANNGADVLRIPRHHYAKNRRTYDANNGTSLPGTITRTEGSGASGDTALDAAHDNAGTTYDFYNTFFGRDSYDNNGATLHSTVHYSNNYNNAFWNGSQMVYGDGDGSTFIELSRSLDVVAHELTHAVTDSESDLIYSYESGAINESMSDIFGAGAEWYADGQVISSNTWLIGEDIYTPGTPGDALRDMSDPQDAGDYDYYPTRYTGSADNGGVHWNSGISNLAFVLLVEGGTHPRGTTTVNVPSIGMTKALNIFYRANTVYLGPSSNFAALRDACADSANDLYGQTEVDAVHDAFDAVGVPNNSGGGGGACQSGWTNYTGSLSGNGDTDAQPNGTYFYKSGTNTFNAHLEGPGGTDFDLYLRKWNGSGWVTVAQSISATSVEDITNYVGSSGYYYWRIVSYSGSGSYTFCSDQP